MLTQKQRNLLIFIHERMSETGVAPSYDEMREALQLKSKSGIHRFVNALVERGYLAQLPNKARALEVKKLPDGYQSQSQNAPIAPKAAANDVVSIPLHGKIAAGTAIEAISHDGVYIDIPSSMIGRGDFYALNVDGDSMIEAGIFDQDIVVIKRTETAQNGDIVVALIDGEEVTLKRLRKNGASVDLIPENRTYETRRIEAERVQIQGILSSLFRQYH